MARAPVFNDYLTATVVTLMYAEGQYLEIYTKQRARRKRLAAGSEILTRTTMRLGMTSSRGGAGARR